VLTREQADSIVNIFDDVLGTIAVKRS
jgi:hypothetical protein